MKAISLVGDVDEKHRLHVNVPAEVPAGEVRVIVLVPQDDAAGSNWTQGVASEWADELVDTQQDIYTVNDGQPVNARR